jgi:hypothetical protein
MGNAAEVQAGLPQWRADCASTALDEPSAGLGGSHRRQYITGNVSPGRISSSRPTVTLRMFLSSEERSSSDAG